MERSFLFLVVIHLFLFYPPQCEAFSDTENHSESSPNAINTEDKTNEEWICNFIPDNCPDQTGSTNSLNTMIDAPIANAVGGILHCSGQMQLNAFGSSQGDNISYFWSTNNGSIVSGENTLTPTIDKTGTYTILVVDNSNQLSSSFSVNVLPETVVDAGDAILYCEDELPLDFNLSGSILGPYLDFSWSSSLNLVDPNVLNPQVFATPFETHELKATVLSGVNLIVNGNFESGNDHFYSQYIDGTDVAGKYKITNNPKEFYNGFASCGDRTSGNGNMMVLDGSALPNQKVWCQVVKVSQNTTYAFSAWFQNVCATCLWGEPEIDFRVNNESLGIVTKKGQGCIWEKFSSLWDSGDNLSAEFCLYTHELDPIGNDFAIDDIEVLASCIQSDAVDVKFDDISADFDFSSLSCDVSEVNLVSNPTGTDISNVTFLWTSLDGQIIEGADSPNPLVQGAGIYNLVITNDNTSCLESLEFVLDGDFEQPDLTATVPLLTCTDSEGLLEGFSETTDVSFQWSTDDGNIVSGENEASALIDQGGIYFLEVTNNATGCSSRIEVLVEDDNDILDFEILPFENISCENQTVVLESNLNLIGVTYEWLTSDGIIVEGETTGNAVVGSEGSYELIITNTTNGCTSSAEVIVSSDVQIPELTLGEDQTIGCGEDAVSLEAISSMNNVSYSWSTSNGTILEGDESSEVMVGTFGFYSVVVTNLENGCTNEGQIEVINDTQSPFVDIGEDKELTCTVSTVLLDASNSETGDHLSYEWTTDDGNILSGENGLNPMVDRAGTYQLKITNTINACETKSRVTVEENVNPPIAEAGSDKELTCIKESVVLGREFFLEDEVEFNWSTSDGQIISNSDQSAIEVNSEGTYRMNVLNVRNGCEAFDVVVVEGNFVKPSLEFFAESIELTCAKNEIEIVSITENLDLSYAWETDNGSILGTTDAEQILVDQPGEYTLQITDNNNGCTTIESTEVTAQRELPQIDFSSPDQFICGTESIDISAINLDDNENLEIKWTTVDGEITSDDSKLIINVSSPATYHITALDTESGCSVEKTIDVTQDVQNPEVKLISDEIITCGLAQVEVKSESELDDLEYIWSTSTGNITSSTDETSINVNTAGTYILEVINPANDCKTTEQIDVFSDISEPIIIISDPEQLTCIRETVDLDASLFSNSDIFEASWTTTNGNIRAGENTLIPTIDQPGDYTLNILNTSNECASTQTITVEQNTEFPLVETVEPEMLTCSVPQTFISLAHDPSDNLNYGWSTTNGQINSDPNRQEVLVEQAGIYNVLVTNIENGCNQVFEIQVEENISFPNIDAGNDFEIDCDFISEKLNAQILDNGNFESLWSTEDGHLLNGIAGLEPLIDQPGHYFFRVTNLENGCISIDSLLVFRNENIPTGILTSIEPPLCFGDDGSASVVDVIGGEGPYLYNLDDQGFQTEEVFASLNPGQLYDLVIQDANGCEKDTSFIIPTVPQLQVNIIPEVNLVIGDLHEIYVQTNIPEETIDQILWTPATYLSCNMCLTPEVQPLADQLYELTIRTQNGCVEKAQILFKVDRDINIYAPNAFTPFDGDGINDFFHLFAAENTVQNISKLLIFDRWGNQVFFQENIMPNDESFAWNGKFRNKNASLGVYMWHAKIELINGETIEMNGDITILD